MEKGEWGQGRGAKYEEEKDEGVREIWAEAEEERMERNGGGGGRGGRREGARGGRAEGQPTMYKQPTVYKTDGSKV